MTMEYRALDDGFHSWEWSAQGLRYQAVAQGGVPDVTLYYREADNPEAYWEFSHVQRTDGNDARSVVEQMVRDTTVVPLNITDRLRIRSVWVIKVGDHKGLYGVGLEPLSLTREELAALRAILRTERRKAGR